MCFQALRLDSLGNLVNCNSPIKDVVPENIVVKKFIFDNDTEAQPPEVKTKGKKKVKT